MKIGSLITKGVCSLGPSFNVLDGRSYARPGEEWWVRLGRSGNEVQLARDGLLKVARKCRCIVHRRWMWVSRRVQCILCLQHCIVTATLGYTLIGIQEFNPNFDNKTKKPVSERYESSGADSEVWEKSMGQVTPQTFTLSQVALDKRVLRAHSVV